MTSAGDPRPSIAVSGASAAELALLAAALGDCAVVAVDVEAAAVGCAAIVYRRSHWDPAWMPPSRLAATTRAIPVVLWCAQAPGRSAAAFFGGIDDWLAANADPVAIRRCLRRLLARPADSLFTLPGSGQ